MNLRRRQLTVVLATGTLLNSARGEGSLALEIEVWKDPACGCCGDWVKHLESEGFRTKTHDGGNSKARARLAMPVKFGSCHTAQVRGYAIEGHVPAREIKRLLRERPVAIGLSVPSMPRGSPGMDGPEYRGNRDAYDVLLISRNGSATVFQSYT